MFPSLACHYIPVTNCCINEFLKVQHTARYNRAPAYPSDLNFYAELCNMPATLSKVIHLTLNLVFTTSPRFFKFLLRLRFCVFNYVAVVVFSYSLNSQSWEGLGGISFTALAEKEKCCRLSHLVSS